MLNEEKIPDIYWREAVYTTVYVLNKRQLKINNDKTPYELWYGRPTSVKYFRVFGSKCYIKRDDNDLGKFDSRTDEGIFLGYSSSKKAYRCYNLKLQKIIESASVIVDDTKPRKIKIQEDENDEAIDDKEEDSQEEEDLQDEKEEEDEESQENEKEDSPRADTKTPSRQVQRDHPENQVIGDINT